MKTARKQRIGAFKGAAIAIEILSLNEIVDEDDGLLDRALRAPLPPRWDLPEGERPR